MRYKIRIPEYQDLNKSRLKFYLAASLIVNTILLLCIAVNCWALTPQEQVIAEVIAAEAANQGTTGLTAVACTIANRARAWHKTPYQIVTQRAQYYGLTAKNRHRLYLQVKPIVDRLARDIMRLTDITGGALYFRQLSEPKFRWCKLETYRYKEHIFYK